MTTANPSSIKYETVRADDLLYGVAVFGIRVKIISTTKVRLQFHIDSKRADRILQQMEILGICTAEGFTGARLMQILSKTQLEEILRNTDYKNHIYRIQTKEAPQKGLLCFSETVNEAIEATFFYSKRILLFAAIVIVLAFIVFSLFH